MRSEARGAIIFNRFHEKYGRLPTEFDKDYLEMLNMSKYVTLDVPLAQPGKCANCGSSKKDGRVYVDFGLQVDWYGTVFMCSLCLKDIATSIGLFDELLKDINKLRDEMITKQELITSSDRLADAVKETFEEVKEYFAIVSDVRDDSSTGDSPSVGIDETTPTNEGNTPTEQGITKQTSSGGLEKLPSFAELLNNKK